ncbi:hypothetical protein RMR16_000370 [Agrobacterium sp. rho-13.3]|jgi:2-phosphoglycerate kinase|uniref:hypothetical protein n=1 Tax=Agrobacterium sp. rho-13.3 TaxID=3072980 RepID=UPI002A0BD8D3|nr:hypothetical protein [Agrobacterium sp. rho-13.3]MDX8310811.1 hypothetical protein [Agrobacterium sp. rho-13.3]
MSKQSFGVLISGSSHVGKTTFATLLAQALRCSLTSTDNLARHPGRPWPNLPVPVAEYYSRLSDETIYWFLKVHHENIWPGIKQKIKAESDRNKPFVFEGTALRPEYIKPLLNDGLLGVCLHADNDFLKERMRSEAHYAHSDENRRGLIDKFINRSLRDNSEMYATAREHGLRTVDVSDDVALAALFDELVRSSER